MLLLIATLAAIVALSLVTPNWPVRPVWPVLAALAATLLAVRLFSGFPLRPWLMSLAALGPVIAAFTLPLAFSVRPHGSLAITSDRLELAGIVALRSILASALVLHTADLLGPRGLPAALARCGLPTLLTSVIALLLRYRQVIGDEALSLHRAQRARGGPTTWRQAWWLSANRIAWLLIRSVRRADRVHAAMVARGLNAPTLSPPCSMSDTSRSPTPALPPSSTTSRSP